MSIFFKKAQKISASIVAVSVWAASFNILALAPVHAVECPELSAGTLFKTPDYSAVYIVNKEHKRMYFPNAEVYATWYSDFSGIVTLNSACVDAYPGGGGVNYRPGSRLIKTAVSPSVYAIGPNNTKHRITSEGTAVVLFGNDWTTKIRMLSDAFDSNLKVGPDVVDSKLVNGQLVRIDDNPQIYFVSDGKLKKVLGTIPTILSKDVHGIREIMLESVPLSTETTTAAEILADPTQMGGVGAVPTVPVTPVNPTTPVNPVTPVVSGTDLISSFSVKLNKPSGLRDFIESYISYGSGVGYPWYPSEGTIDEDTISVNYTVVSNKSNTSFGYGFITSVNKPEFTKEEAQLKAGTALFSASKNSMVSIFDSNRGKWVMWYVFARNNDGISQVPGMPVEVDDIAVARIYIPTKSQPVINSSHIIDTLSLYNTNNELLGYANSGYLRLNGYAAKQLIEVPSSVNQFTLRVNRSVNAPSANYTYGYIWVNSETGSTGFDENLAKNLAANLNFSSYSNGLVFNVSDFYRGKYVTVLAYIRNNDGVSRVPNMPVEVDDVIAIHIKIPAKVADSPVVVTPPTPSTPAITSTGEISLRAMTYLQPKTIDFEDIGGEVNAKYVSLYGVTIWSNNGRAIYSNEFNRGSKTSSGLYSIFNDADFPKTSNNDPLLLSFNTPVKAFGFYVIGPGNLYSQQIQATVTVYGASGKVLGTVSRSVAEWTTSFIGFQAQESIYKVSIDYGATAIGEQIDDLMVVR